MRLTRTTRIRNAVSRTAVTTAARCTEWADWKKVYEQLLIQGRIWDFRDVLVTIITYFSLEEAMDAFFAPESNNAIDIMLKDWKTDEPDEPTQLALLDIMSFLAISACSSSNVSPLAESYLEAADALGESVLQNFPDDVKSRPFLQWVIAKAAISARRGKRSPLSFDYLADYPGESVLPKRIGIPYYIPVRQENPGWVVPEIPPKSLEPLEMSLKAARELDDYQTQATCLKELIIRSKTPATLFDELSTLQKSAQQNMDGYLATCLSKYLICKDEESKRKLRAELADFGWWEEPSDVVSPIRAATRDVLMRALSPIDVEYIPNSIRAGVKYYKSLPAFFQHLIDQHVPPEPGKSRSAAPLKPRSSSPTRVPSSPAPPEIIIRNHSPPMPPPPASPANGRPGRMSRDETEGPIRRHDEAPETQAAAKEAAGDIDIEIEEIQTDQPGPPLPVQADDTAEPALDPSYDYYPPVDPDIDNDRGRSRAEERDRVRFEDDYYYREASPPRGASPGREDGSGSDNNWRKAKSLALVAADRFAGSFADKAATRLKSWEEKMEQEPESSVEYEIPRSTSRTRNRARARSRSRSRSRARSRSRSVDSSGRRKRDKTTRNIATGLALVAAGALAGGLASYRDRRKQRDKDRLEDTDRLENDDDVRDRRYPTRQERRRNRLRQEEIRERRERRKQRKRSK